MIRQIQKDRNMSFENDAQSWIVSSTCCNFSSAFLEGVIEEIRMAVAMSWYNLPF
jgi:hypothetical protein